MHNLRLYVVRGLVRVSQSPQGPRGIVFCLFLVYGVDVATVNPQLIPAAQLFKTGVAKTRGGGACSGSHKKDPAFFGGPYLGFLVP